MPVVTGRDGYLREVWSGLHLIDVLTRPSRPKPG